MGDLKMLCINTTEVLPQTWWSEIQEDNLKGPFESEFYCAGMHASFMWWQNTWASGLSYWQLVKEIFVTFAESDLLEYLDRLNHLL